MQELIVFLFIRSHLSLEEKTKFSPPLPALSRGPVGPASGHNLSQEPGKDGTRPNSTGIDRSFQVAQCNYVLFGSRKESKVADFFVFSQ